METLLLATDENVKQIPNMELAQKLFRYEYSLKNDVVKVEGLKSEIISILKEDSMISLYKRLCEKYNWEISEELVLSFGNKLAAEVKVIDDKIADAIENAGDAEVCLFLLLSE